MTLQIIGAGFGRTGTKSMKAALEKLGCGPCYHMVEVFQNPAHIPLWAAAAEGELPDWDVLFDGYGSTVDWPSTAYWKPLAAHYPDAKVLLTRRDADAWYDSCMATIFPGLDNPDKPGAKAHLPMASNTVYRNTFASSFERQHCIEVYERHNQHVIDSVPADRLLVYEVGSGWSPLCELLNLPVPDEDYPHTNTTGEFQARYGKAT